MFTTHQSYKSAATMAVYNHSVLIPFGVIVAKDNKFLSCIEKPVIQKMINMALRYKRILPKAYTNQ